MMNRTRCFCAFYPCEILIQQFLGPQNFARVESAELGSAHGGGRVVSAFGLETSVSSSTPTSAIIYDAYSSIIKNKKKFLGPWEDLNRLRFVIE